MKSKKKLVNKFKNKDQLLDSQQDNAENIKRATGAIPFHLSKLRIQKKHNEEFFNKKLSLKLMADKYLAQNANSDRRNMYLDLIINKKLLIDGQKNIKLQSERKNLLYLDAEQNDQAEALEIFVDNVDTEKTEFKNVNSQHLQAIKSQELTNNLYKPKKSISKCSCCHQMQGFKTQAIICKNSDLKDNLSPSSQRSNSQHSQNVIDSKAELRNIIQKASKSPFSFTNVKWRSKSDLTVVDKWKQKYEKSNELSNQALKKHKSVSKILGNQLQQKQQFSAGKRGVLQKIKRQNEKLNLPSIKRQSQLANHVKAEQIIKQVNKLQAIIEEKKMQRQQKKQLKKQVQLKINPQSEKKVQVQSDLFLERQNTIVIKEMYSKKPQPQVQYHQTQTLIANQLEDKQKQDALLAMTKYQRQKNKKTKVLRSKFPQIKVSTFYSVKENDEQKKTKLHNLQKVISQSKIRAPKKIYFQKQLEEIPERWQYGQSRQQSRQEVQNYLSIKRQQELRQLTALQEQKKRLLEMQLLQNIEQTIPRKESIEGMQQNLIKIVV